MLPPFGSQGADALESCTSSSLLSLDGQRQYAAADLHPGNIMVRVVDPNSLWGRVAHFFNLNTAPHLVLLDVGMTAELSPHDQRHIVSFFKVRLW